MVLAAAWSVEEEAAGVLLAGAGRDEARTKTGGGKPNNGRRRFATLRRSRSGLSRIWEWPLFAHCRRLLRRLWAAETPRTVSCATQTLTLSVALDRGMNLAPVDVEDAHGDGVHGMRVRGVDIRLDIGRARTGPPRAWEAESRRP